MVVIQFQHRNFGASRKVQCFQHLALDKIKVPEFRIVKIELLEKGLPPGIKQLKVLVGRQVYPLQEMAAHSESPEVHESLKPGKGIHRQVGYLKFFYSKQFLVTHGPIRIRVELSGDKFPQGWIGIHLGDLNRIFRPCRRIRFDMRLRLGHESHGRSLKGVTSVCEVNCPGIFSLRLQF